MNQDELSTGPLDDAARSVRTAALSDLEVDLKVDSVCDAFEGAWQAGARPELSDFLADTRLPASTLFVELVQIDMDYRRRTGERISLEEYAARYPEFSGALSRLAPALDTASVLPVPGVSAPGVSAPGRPAPVLGRFELVAPLGEGTFGVVWKAHDTKLRTWVAIKRFREAILLQNRELFAREARALRKLSHPHVVQFLELSQGALTDYIVFEFVDGQNLKQVLEEPGGRPLEPERAARIALQLAEGLQHVHEHRIIHRDVKPANIMLAPDGTAKILDFGLARHTDAASTIARKDGLLGTVPYMSPEQCRGESVSAATDIYSLGVVLYEMLAGRRPFEGSPADLIARIPKGNPPPLEAPPSLQAIVRRAMEVDPRDRYGSAKEFSQDLDRSLKGLEPASPIAATLGKWGRKLTRRDALVKGAAGLAAAAGTIRAASVLMRDPQDGRHNVLLKTVPDRAEVHIVPLHAVTGEPDPYQIRRVPGLTPVMTRLPPGNFLMIAVLPQTGQFHEVFRKVPQHPRDPIGSAYHQQWFAKESWIEVPEIRIPPLTVTAGMTRFEGADRFSTGEEGSSQIPRHVRSIPPFYLNRTEITVADYRKAFRGDFPHDARWIRPPSEDYAVTLTWDFAVFLAETQGKRLMHECEYEFAATDGGRRSPLWAAESLSPIDAGTKFRPVGEPNEDRVGTPPVYGLCSNVAEWTSTWSDARYQGPVDDRHKELASQPTYRVARGGSSEIISGNADVVATADRDARTRTPKTMYLVAPGLGMRCARSAQPRLQPQDFIRVLL